MNFKKKGAELPHSGGDGAGVVDFRGERRTNATHESTSDPEVKLMRKGNGQPAKLSYGAHALMENRHGLLLDIAITDATRAEPRAATDRRRFARGAYAHARCR